MPSNIQAPFKLEPGKRDWPSKWPIGPRIPSEQAVRVVRSYQESLNPDDYRLLLLIARHYPWAYPSRETMAKELGTTVWSIKERLEKLERNGWLESFPSQISQEEYTAHDFDNARSLRRITRPGLHTEMKPRSVRRCEHCGGLIPPSRRADAKHCKDSHRKAANKVRRSIREGRRRVTDNHPEGVGYEALAQVA